MRPIYVLPNLFTTASLFSGLCSIIFTSEGRFVEACYLILLSAVLDALDGPIARWTRTSSSFGLQYDSLADLVAFGVAPAFLMLNQLSVIDRAADLPHWAPRMALGVCGLYVICGAIRLARFNIQAATTEKTHFTGMPVPAAAGTVISTFLVIEQYVAPGADSQALHRALLVLMLILSYLMVSTYPFPSLHAMKRRMRRSINSLVTAVFIIFILVAFYQHLPAFALLVAMGYIVLAMWKVIVHKRNLRRYSPGTELPLTDDDDDDFPAR